MSQTTVVLIQVFAKTAAASLSNAARHYNSRLSRLGVAAAVYVKGDQVLVSHNGVNRILMSTVPNGKDFDVHQHSDGMTYVQELIDNAAYAEGSARVKALYADESAVVQKSVHTDNFKPAVERFTAPGRVLF